MSGNRKRTGGGHILDQLEPKAVRGKAPPGFKMGIEPGWMWAGGGAIALLVAALASIAWSSTTTAKALPPPVAPLAQESAAAAVKPVFEAGPAKVERIPLQSHKAAAVLLAQVEPPMPPAMPLVVLPKEAAARVVRQPAVQKPPLVAAPKAAKPAAPRQASRRGPVRQRAKPVPVAQAAHEADPDVALIRAIRKATQPPSK